MDIAIMIEGQNGLTWDRWRAVARAVEDLGFAGLYRSDHFTNPAPPDRESLELWVSLAWLATHTARIAFGPLVTPCSFRHPVHTARMAAAVDDLSGGRLTLGMGAGWQEREHALFGFDLLDLRERFVRFEESLEVATRLLRSDGPVTFSGRYYRLNGAVLLPRPRRPGGPPILVGGNGIHRTLPLAARYAAEWNATFQTPQAFAGLSRRLDALLQARGQDPQTVRRSLMTGVVFGSTEQEVRRRLERRGRPVEQLRARGVVVGTPQEVVDQLAAFEKAGVQRVMLQWLDLDDLDGLEALARAVLPHFPPSSGGRGGSHRDRR
ncbi:MAG: TIGR03560 family F420-dependent LLM class oxidoreductase [Armatimonadota bacterium]|nr:TIGR03560 family F420-dependent LLM class oxidoreductase [Armatimonadota bacterium]MDR7400852.1 TIGR03560 family F420-dependent LLM class oxidoreductase [Armatimonadota bacterium]MDR7404691.1 TIGR03560 family F420-dependent LLM class oxidoreductase [Armatimonadota bacterium]MDR7437808.1 TIGR03560 family F420-dependent LLM class oxidoreductase [Armatimonadota bacterium]MDR7473133.1 TIGR03560 family F420-dependent LLM class oxidoreductase [Armatimonadota bacterium]